MKNDPAADEDETETPENEKIHAILNLACVVMSRQSTPAMKEKAENILCNLYVGWELRPDLMVNPTVVDGRLKEWAAIAREACPNWRDNL